MKLDPMRSRQIKNIELKPLKDSDKDFEVIEKKLRALWKNEIYLPLIKELGEKSSVLKNSTDNLLSAIKSGRIEYYHGSFSGKFNATISKELKDLGAQWDRKTETFKLPQTALTIEIRNAISASVSHFHAKIAGIDHKLMQILPVEIADKFKIESHLDQTLWKVEKEFNGSLRNLTVAPTLERASRRRLAVEWATNMKLWIKTWTIKAVTQLRKDLQASVFAGNRNEAAIKIIKDSYGQSINKAKFLARQETRLLLTKYKQTRYEDAGVNEYRWSCANRPHQPSDAAPLLKGEVRHDHAVLEGKIFRWDNPPITNHETGARNNPGQDFNCRCFAIPIVSFKGEPN
jgi:SPP1 gp7 family putative phage head morphogenesis protein